MNDLLHCWQAKGSFPVYILDFFQVTSAHDASKWPFFNYEPNVFQSTQAYEYLVTFGASKLLHFCMSCDFMCWLKLHSTLPTRYLMYVLHICQTLVTKVD